MKKKVGDEFPGYTMFRFSHSTCCDERSWEREEETIGYLDGLPASLVIVVRLCWASELWTIPLLWMVIYGRGNCK